MHNTIMPDELISEISNEFRTEIAQFLSRTTATTGATLEEANNGGAETLYPVALAMASETMAIYILAVAADALKVSKPKNLAGAIEIAFDKVLKRINYMSDESGFDEAFESAMVADSPIEKLADTDDDAFAVNLHVVGGTDHK